MAATLNRSTISDSRADTGGGISNSGTLILTETTVFNNHGAQGIGGLGNSGQVTLIDSTVSSNSGVDAIA